MKNNFDFNNILNLIINTFVFVINKLQEDIILYSIVALISLIIGYLWGSYRRSNKPNKGEGAVMHKLTQLFSGSDYHIFNNITIPYKEGTTQIDHILVSRYGIFVIETKNYSGWIFGNPLSKKWTQIIYNEKTRFQNPIHQNIVHVNALRKLLDFHPPETFHSIIVFTGSAEIKTEVPNNVIYINDLFSYINAFRKEVMSQNRLEFCVGRIESHRYQISRQTDFEHQEYLRKKHGYLD